MIMDNDDVLTEILLRLPGKALIRFTSVSKKWRSLISSDYFCRLHTLRRPKPPPSSLLIQTDFGSLLYLNHTIKGKNKALPYTLPLSDAGDRLQYWIRNGCNGLLLLESPIRSTQVQLFQEDLPLNNRYYVLNPTTKQSREIDTLPRTYDYPYVSALTLVFDPLKSPYYKIVCVTSNSKNEYSSDPTYYQIHVYDSEFHEWELKLGPFAYPDESLFKYRGGVLWNDAVYWSSSICYDLVENEIKTLPCPPIHRDNHGDLQEFNGRLYHFVEHHHDDISSQHEGFTVGEWELGGDGEGRKWVLKRYLQFRPHSPHDDDYDCFRLVKFMGGGGGEGPTYCLMTFHYDREMRAYNFLEDNEFEDVDFPDYLPHHHHYYHSWYGAEAFLFGEVLAPV